MMRVGDTVIVVSGGNKKKRPLKGKTGKILSFDDKNRVVVEGLNHSTRHQRAKTANETGGKVQKESGIHISNLAYYSEKKKGPVKLEVKVLKDGKKVRGYLDGKEFVQI